MLNIAKQLSTNLTNIVNKLYNCNSPPLAVSLDYKKYTYRSENLYRLAKSCGVEPDTFCKDVCRDLDNDNYTCTSNSNHVVFALTNTFLMGHFKNLVNTKNAIAPTEKPLKILVDFSSPNIAKDMHVGHLRSTIIGDSVARLYERLGHNVLRINHIGDFGLQFGMLIQYMFENNNNSDLTISDLQDFYAKSKKRFDSDDVFKAKAYEQVVKLQQGDEKVVAAWEKIKAVSRDAYNYIYKELNIKLEEVGESFYQKYIPDMIEELRGCNLLKFDEGRYIYNTGRAVPLTVIKSDGGYTYDTTDLAAIRYRLMDVKADKIYYVVDIGQSDHFKDVFSAAKDAGWLRDQHVEHIQFGLVLGETGGKFKSRDGNTVKLVDLLNEAVVRVGEFVNSGKIVKRVDMTVGEKEHIIKTVAYAAIKYADLSCCRTSNYRFSMDGMLALDGNTAPAMLYAYARLSSIIKKVSALEVKCVELEYNEKAELQLVQHLLSFPEIIDKLGEDLMFHTLCTYLYNLARVYNLFVEKHRIIDYNENGEVKSINYSRLVLSEMTRKIMGECFEILNITPLEKI
jgi:arginyl-tRNA synthetase